MAKNKALTVQDQFESIFGKKLNDYQKPAEGIAYGARSANKSVQRSAEASKPKASKEQAG